MQTFQTRMDVIGNNIANVNTTGYKSSRADFADTLSQTIRNQPVGAMQIGTGVNTASIQTQFTQGAISTTNSPTDMAISGQGFFTVRDTATNLTYATRAGDFRLDSSGYLVTSQGLRLQGYNDAGLTTGGDLKVDSTGAPATATPGASVASFNIDALGKISVRLTDGTDFVRAQVLLQNFQNPTALTKEGNNLYGNTLQAGPLATSAAPGSSGLGKLQASALELSNVELSNEFVSMITTQRAFQASARVITTSDDVLQEVVNLKR